MSNARKPSRRNIIVPALVGGGLAFLFLLLSSIQAPPAVQADAGPALEESTVVGSIVSPYKFIPTRVRMVDEQVRLKVLPVTFEEKIYHQLEVQADFHLFNTSTVTESMQAVFPLTDLKCPWVAGPGGWTFREDVIDEPSFTVSIDGQVVATEPITTTTVINQEFDAGGSGITLECKTEWKQFAVTFPPRRDARIQVSYRMLPSFELGPGMAGYPWDSFTYILKTGAPWYGSIGQVDISMELPDLAKKEYFLKLPAGYRIQGNSIRWRWRNIEPEQNFQVVMMSLQTQKDLAEAKKQVEAEPEEAEAWAKLAGTYESLAWRHDYLAGCGSTIEYATFSQIQNWEYARLALGAYQQLLALRLDDPKARTNYANLLAGMSLSANNGVLMEGYPSVKRVSREFERALALEAAERPQQLLDSFQRCIVKSKADPPVCQCGF